MTKWWRSLALMTALGAASPGWGQQNPAASDPIPLPVAPTPLPGNTPTPMRPLGPTGPMGAVGPNTAPGRMPPRDPATPPLQALYPPPLSAELSAFSLEQPSHWDGVGEFWKGPGVYFSAGVKALQAKRLDHGPLAVADPIFIDTGAAPPAGTPVLLGYPDAKPPWNVGFTMTAGTYWDTGALEVTGYYLPEAQTTRTVIFPGGLDGYFFNPPAGFFGNNGLWTQADRMDLSYQTEQGNVELNYRCWSPALLGAHGILGVRFYDLRERLQLYTDDNNPTIGVVDNTLIATYSTAVESKIVGPQVGFEVQHACCEWLGLGLWGKSCFGANFATFNNRLDRGDGLQAFDVSTSKLLFTTLLDGGASVDLYALSRFRLRAAYDVMWLLNAPEAVSQVNFNLAQPTRAPADGGYHFFHGPRLELQIQF